MTKEKQEVKYVYLAVDKAYYGSGLKPLEILIMSQIDNYVEKGMECYVTNEQFATDFNVDIKTIKRTLNNLEEKGYIKRNTEMRKDRGRASRKRTLDRGESWGKHILPYRILRD